MRYRFVMAAKIKPTEKFVELDLIDRPEEIARLAINDEELTGLADSIRERGLQQPIKLARRGDRFLIVYGDRRFLAHKKLGLTKIRATVVDAADDEIILDRFIENVQRVNLSPLEEALQYQGMRDKLGMSIEQIARRVGKTAGTVDRRFRLLGMDRPLMDAVHKRLISLSVAEELWQIKEDSHRSYLLEMSCEHGVTVAVAHMWVDDWRKSQAAERGNMAGGRGEGPVSLERKVYLACGLCNGPEEVGDLQTISVCKVCLQKLYMMLDSNGRLGKGGD
ncbi:Nucleoid occlusion protein [subsurface metagenome]